jgi:DNA polymerase III subunit delta
VGVLKPASFDEFLRKQPPDICAVLIHGADAEAVRELAKRAVIKIAGITDDPFSVARLDDAALASDPGRLADEFASLSMLGSERVVWVTDADQAFLKSVEAILNGSGSGNLIVAESGNLAKTSRLRTVFEKSERALAIAVYDDDDDQIAALIESILSPLGLVLAPDASVRLLELLGMDRTAARQEIGKLATYCLGADEISLEDVETICGESSGEGADGLIDAVFAGEVEHVDRGFTTLTAAGTDPGRIMTLAGLHVVKLQSLKLDVERGMRVEDALRSARPPVFFKRHDAVRLQLRIWDLAALLSAASTLSSCTLQMRRTPALAETLASRTLLALARHGQALHVALK